MDMTAIVQAVSTVGFPIVACGAMFWLCNSTMKDLRDSIAENTKALIELRGHIENDQDNS